jgi:leader peptidase (prepilin peptidase) / N-methyltransferase
MLLLIYFFFFGAIIGSFLNVVILRLPKEETLLGRSQCPNCKHFLSATELFPIFSFLFLKGKCKNCRIKISWRYIALEFLTGGLFAFAFWYLYPQDLAGYLVLFKSFLVISLFITIFAIDFEHFLILDSVLIFGILSVSLINLILDINQNQLFPILSSAVFSGLIIGSIAVLPFFALWYFSNGRALGFGDVKFAFLLGIIFGWPLTLVCIFLAIMLGGFISIWLLLLANKNLKSHVPFGTFLSLAGFIALFWGQKILAWYLSLLGL